MAPLISAVHPDEVPDRLNEVLGLDVRVLTDAVRHGFEFASTCTGHDTRSMPGTLMWGKTTAALRDGAASAGWDADWLGGQEGILCPDRRRAIVVTAGNWRTGRYEGLPPNARHPRGAVAVGTVQPLADLFTLLPGGDVALPEPEPEISRAPYEMWWLLHYWDRRAKEVRCEVSRPTAIEAKTHVAWGERLPLPAVKPEVVSDAFEMPQDDDIDFDLPERF